MTPWAYTDDMAVPLNAARAMLGEADADTARIPDESISTALATFGWQRGMSMLAQRLIVEIGQDVSKSQQSGGSTFEWNTQRLDGLKALKAQADRGVLPDPEQGQVNMVVPGSIVLGNSPQW